MRKAGTHGGQLLANLPHGPPTEHVKMRRPGSGAILHEFEDRPE